jgi:SnoaL-like domain
MSEELLLTVYERAWNAHDPEACARCFAAGGRRETRLRQARTVAVGREAIRDEIALVMDALPDLAVAVVAAGYASDRRLWTEWEVTGTRVAEAGGGRVTVVGVSVFRLSNAGFRDERLYWDSAFARRPGPPGEG